MADWKRIEAVLFASGKYLTEQQIIELTGIPKNQFKKTMDSLKKHYETSDTALQLFQETDAWKLNVKEEYNDIIKNIVSDAEMAKPIMETLAMIAYRSPVLQSEIIDARGSGAYDHISLLEDKGFLTREKYARTFKLRVTEKFFEYFDIDGDKDLGKVFGNIKKPEVLGTLEVYTAKKKTEEEEFADKIIERMKKLEETDKDKEDNHEFLENMDKKLAESKTRIDEAEEDMKEFKKAENPENEQIPEGTEHDTFIKNINQKIDEITGNEEETEPEQSEEDSEDEDSERKD